MEIIYIFYHIKTFGTGCTCSKYLIAFDFIVSPYVAMNQLESLSRDHDIGDD